MYSQVLKSIIVEGQEIINDIDVVRRDFEFEANARYVFVGVRQAGKSYLLYLRAKQLISEGADPRQMLFVNFDDERLIGMTASQLDLILQAYASLFDLKPIIFLDEIQNLDGWEHFVRRLANQKYQVYVTGSNAKMLSRDIATTLGARYVEQRVFPYSFQEFLIANEISLSTNWMYGKQKSAVERLLSAYFMWGGFPELLNYVNKRHWLNELYEKIILGDILQRNKIRNEQAMRLTIKRLAENVKTPISYNRLANIVRATGVNTSPASVMDYVKMCTDACLIFPVDNFASKFVEKETVKKHYFVDNGLLTIFLDNSETALLENLCAITLYKRCLNSEEKLYFYNKEVELDFYLPGKRQGIQVAYSISDPQTLDREVKALIRFHELYGLDHATIVTYDQEQTIHTETIDIQVIPLSKFLLNN